MAVITEHTSTSIMTLLTMYTVKFLGCFITHKAREVKVQCYFIRVINTAVFMVQPDKLL